MSSIPARGEAAPRALAGDIRHFARSHYKVLAATTILGVLAAYFYTGAQIPQFRATATVEIQDLNENFLNREVSQLTPFAQAPVANDIQTHLRILQSGSLIARTIENLPGETIPPPRGIAAWIARFASDPPAPVARANRDAMVDRASRNLSVRETRQSRIVDLTYESPDAAYAAAFANGLAQRYIEQSIEARLEISRGTSAFLEKQLADAGGKMAASEHRLQDYARRSGLLVTSEEHRPDEERFRQIQESLSKAQENRMVKQARMETAAGAPLESLDVPLGSVLRDYQAKLADLRRQRADLTTVFTSDFDGVKRLDAQIARLEADQRRESASILQAIRNEYADALRRERLLESSYQDQFSKVTEQAGIAIQYGILKREVDTHRDLYNNLLQRTAEAKVASALRASGARIVDPARIPSLPFKPSRILNLLWGATAGMLLGLVFAAIRRSPRDEDHAARGLAMRMGVRELGWVPKIPAFETAASSQLWGAEAGFMRIPGQEPSVAEGIATTAWNDRDSRQANAFRSILTSILLSRQNEDSPKVIVVTSAHPKEGKTTLVSNLAAVLAQTGRQVLVVDACQNRALHGVLRASTTSSLRDMLELLGDSTGLLPFVTSGTIWNGVSLVHTGNRADQALDLIYAPGLASILHEMRQNYDAVLIDAPSLDELPDARILGRMADGVVLVVQDGEGRLQAALEASGRLREDGASVLGTVWNRAS